MALLTFKTIVQSEDCLCEVLHCAIPENRHINSASFEPPEPVEFECNILHLDESDWPELTARLTWRDKDRLLDESLTYSERDRKPVA